MKKLYFKSIVLVLHIHSCFLEEKQIINCSKGALPRDVSGTHLRDIPGTK